MELLGAKILITGGAGFIGSHVVEALLKTKVAQVVIFDNFTRGTRDNLSFALSDPRCTIYPNGGDIRDLDLLDDAMKNCDAVFHLASMWLLHCQDFPRTAFDVNIARTFNVLEACLRNKVKRVIYSSSASVYGDANEEFITEDHPFNNRNFYGATKISGEVMCRAFYERYGLSYVGLRYMNVYGPRQNQLSAYTGIIATTLNKITKNERPLVFGDGKQNYDFINVKDIARANLLALQSEVTDCFINVGTGTRTSINKLISTLIRLTGSKIEPLYQEYSETDSRKLIKSRVASVEAAINKLGFVSSVRLEEGLKELIDWRDGSAKC